MACYLFTIMVLALAVYQYAAAPEELAKPEELQKPGSCTCPAPPPKMPGLPVPPENGDDESADDQAEPKGKPPHPGKPGPGMRRPRGGPHPGGPPGPKPVCGTDGKKYPSMCEFVNAQANAPSLGERPCEPEGKPHCLNNGTTVNIHRPELDKLLKASPMSLGLACPGPCPCQLKCPPRGPPRPPKGRPHPGPKA